MDNRALDRLLLQSRGARSLYGGELAKKPVNKKKPAAKMGRPTEYRPEYCQQLITHMAKGGSFESFGADANCHRGTLYDWEAAHPDFADA